MFPSMEKDVIKSILTAYNGYKIIISEWKVEEHFAEIGTKVDQIFEKLAVNFIEFSTEKMIKFLKENKRTGGTLSATK